MMNRSRTNLPSLIRVLAQTTCAAVLLCMFWSTFLSGGSHFNDPRAIISATHIQIGAFKSALDAYVYDNGEPPTTAQGLPALIRRPVGLSRPSAWKGPYLLDTDDVPLDPWGTPYAYQCPVPGAEPYLITSYGKNCRPGGTDYDADITSAGVRK